MDDQAGEESAENGYLKSQTNWEIGYRQHRFKEKKTRESQKISHPTGGLTKLGDEGTDTDGRKKA